MTLNSHTKLLAVMYTIGALMWASAVLLYWAVYNRGYYHGFAEGEDHNAMMHEEARREQAAWERQERERAMDALIEETVGCLERCEEAGYPSLNAFYVRDRARCMCQHPNPTDDVHGFFWLYEEEGQ